jgi:hypothetical protein
MGQRVQTLEGKLPIAPTTDPELIGVLVQATERVFDAVKVAPLLAREEKRFLPLHCTHPWISHMERIAGSLGVEGLPRGPDGLLKETERAECALTLPKEAVFQMLKMDSIHSFQSSE